MSFNKSIYEELILESNDQQRTVDIRNGTLAIQYFEDIFSPTITAKVKVVNTGNSIPSFNNSDGENQSIYNVRLLFDPIQSINPIIPLIPKM